MAGAGEAANINSVPTTPAAPRRMRACGITAWSGPVRLLDLEPPRSPGPGEILLDVLAAGVGPWDRLLASGAWDVGLRPPAALGTEGAGRVLAVGEGVHTASVGDLVLAHSVPLPGHSGFWTEQVLIPAQHAAPIPIGLDPRDAAALPVSGLTARQALDRIGLSPGERLLLTNGAGVTGSLILQLAVAAGVSVTATASPGSFERVRGLGASAVVDYNSPTWPYDAPGGFDAALVAAPGTAEAAASLVRPGGRLCSLTSDAPDTTPDLSSSNLYVLPDAAALRSLAVLLRNGSLALPTQLFPLTDAPAVADGSAVRLTGGAKPVLSIST
jgi:NADPH:quinone reductase-like Zn-dependent oxidoreductase